MILARRSMNFQRIPMDVHDFPSFATTAGKSGMRPHSSVRASCFEALPPGDSMISHPVQKLISSGGTSGPGATLKSASIPREAQRASKLPQKQTLLQRMCKQSSILQLCGNLTSRFDQFARCHKVGMLNNFAIEIYRWKTLGRLSNANTKKKHGCQSR